MSLRLAQTTCGDSISKRRVGNGGRSVGQVQPAPSKCQNLGFIPRTSMTTKKILNLVICDHDINYHKDKVLISMFCAYDTYIVRVVHGSKRVISLLPS